MKKNIFLVFLYIGVSQPILAATVTQSYTNTTRANVDPNQSSPVNRAVTVPVGDFPASFKIIDVDISISFDKRDADNGRCRRYQGGAVYNQEIYFELIKTGGSSSILVPFNTYSGNVHPAPTNNGYITVNFDDSATTTVGGGTPVAGTFAPVNPLSVFNDVTPDGDWVLRLADSAGQDPLCFNQFVITITASNEADISVVKTDGATTYTPGESGSYTITVSNAGPISVEGALINDTLPNGATGATWTCVGAGGSSCATASDSGNIVNQSVNLAVGGTVTFTVDFTWSTNPADY